MLRYAPDIYLPVSWHYCILTASIDCVSLHQAWYFDRDDVALKGFCKFFKKSSEEEREHAEKMMKYQNSRGGRLVFQPIDVR